MSYIRTTAIIGLLIFIMPFLGFFDAWKNVFYVVFGLILMVLASLRYQRMRTRKRPISHEEIREQLTKEQ